MTLRHSFTPEASPTALPMLIIDRQNNIINALRLGYGQSEARRQQVRQEHRALLEATRKGDSKRAGTIAASHARNARNDLIAAMRDRGQNDDEGGKLRVAGGMGPGSNSPVGARRDRKVRVLCWP